MANVTCLLWVTRSLTRLGRWLVCKTRQVQHNMSHCGVLSWGGVQAKNWTMNFCLFFGSSSTVILNIFHNKMGTSPVSSTSTLEEHGGAVGKWIMQLSMQVSVSELPNTKDLLRGLNSVVMPQYHACFLNLSFAALAPIDRVQPRSITTCVGWLARFKEVAHPCSLSFRAKPPSS